MITEVKRTGDGSTPDYGNYDVTVILDSGYESKYLLNASTKYLDGEYTHPQSYRLQVGPSWSKLSGDATEIAGKPDHYSFSSPITYFAPKAGHKLLTRGKFLFCNQVTDSTRTIINDFTILSCAGFSWFSTSNHKTTFKSLSIRPAGFAPPGGTELPARSSSADGVHRSGDFVGPTFNHCFFSTLDNDCMETFLTSPEMPTLPLRS